jgi:hypothetical protein
MSGGIAVNLTGSIDVLRVTMNQRFLPAPVVTGLALLATLPVTTPASASAATASCTPVQVRLDQPSLAESYLPDTRVLAFACAEKGFALPPGKTATFILPVRDPRLATRLLEAIRRAESRHSPVRISFDRRGGLWDLGFGRAIEVDRIEF